MATKQFNARISLKYDTYANWVDKNPVLLAGEAAVAVVPASTGAVQQEPAVLIKIGDGTKQYNDLPFISGKAADVYTWALQPNKPTYTANEISGLADYISGKVQDTNTTYKIDVDSENPRKFTLKAKELGSATWTDVSTITIPTSALTTGSANGTVSFNGTDVAVKGLGSAAYKNVGDFDAAGAASAVLGNSSDESTANTVYGVKALANTKVSSVGATANKGIEIGGTATSPTVGIKLDSTAGNAATLSAKGLMVTIPSADAYSIVKEETSSDYAAVYHLTKNGSNVGAAINVPKDMVVSSGSVEVNPAGQPEGTYLVLTLANATSDKIYISVDSLIEYVTGGTATDGIITTSVSDDFVLTATINDGTITLSKLNNDLQTAIGRANSSVQSVTTGTANGTIKVDGTAVAVHGLKSAAYTESSAYDAAGAAAAVLGKDSDASTVVTVKGNRSAITAIQESLANKIDASSVSAIGKSGNINDAIQTAGDALIINCGTSSTVMNTVS